jgi:hypothetical protein
MKSLLHVLLQLFAFKGLYALTSNKPAAAEEWLFAGT